MRLRWYIEPGSGKRVLQYAEDHSPLDWLPVPTVIVEPPIASAVPTTRLKLVWPAEDVEGARFLQAAVERQQEMLRKLMEGCEPGLTYEITDVITRLAGGAVLMAWQADPVGMTPDGSTEFRVPWNRRLRLIIPPKPQVLVQNEVKEAK